MIIRIILILMLGCKLNYAQQLKDSLVVNANYKVDCCCKIENVIVLDVTNMDTTKRDKYRFAFLKRKPFNNLDPLLKKGNSIYLNFSHYYDVVFVGGPRMGASFKLTSSKEAWVYPSEEHSFHVIDLHFDILEKYNIKKRCPRKVARVFKS